MAIFHLHIQHIGKSANRSVVSASAYRSGAKMCEYDSEGEVENIYDFRNKKGVVFSKIFVPENSSIWMKDRETLWNEIKNKFDTRINSVFAQEIDVALPIELGLEDNQILLSKYVEEILVAEGMIADVNIHMDNPNNPHAHLMLSTREIIEDKKGEFTFGKKVRYWDRKDFLVHLRKSWADYVNHHIALKGLDIRISHLSNKAQGIDLKPGIKEGAGRNIENSDRSQLNNQVKEENAKRIINDPTIIIDSIINQRPLFSRKDIEKELGRFVWQVSSEMVSKVIESERVIYSDLRDIDGRILYKDLKRSNLENKFLHLLDELKGERGAILAREDDIEHQSFLGQMAIKIGFKSEPIFLSEMQRQAVIKIVNGGMISLVEGLPGTGKTTIVKEIARLYKNHGRRIIASSVSSNVANVLGKAIGAEATNLTKLRYDMEKSNMSDFDLDLPLDHNIVHEKNIICSKTVLIIDEASMVDLAEMHYFVKIVREKGAKLILIGDRNQLSSIRLKGAYEQMAKYFIPVRLDEIRRHESAIHRDATLHLANNELQKALELYHSQNDFIYNSRKEVALEKLACDFTKSFLGNKHSLTQALAYRNSDVASLNLLIHNKLKDAGYLGRGKRFLIIRQEEKVQINLSIKDRIIFTKNNKALGVFRGDRGVIKALFGHQIHIKLDRKGRIGNPIFIAINNKAFQNLDYAYATNIHKSQGSTYNNVFALFDNMIDYHSFNVMATRHINSFKVYVDEAMLGEEGTKLDNILSIISNKDIRYFTKDYPEDNKLLEDYLDAKDGVIKLVSEGKYIGGKERELINLRKSLAKQIYNDFDQYQLQLQQIGIGRKLLRKHAMHDETPKRALNNTLNPDFKHLIEQLSVFISKPQAPIFPIDKKMLSNIEQLISKIDRDHIAGLTKIEQMEIELHNLSKSKIDNEKHLLHVKNYMEVLLPNFLESIFSAKSSQIFKNWENTLHKNPDNAFELIDQKPFLLGNMQEAYFSKYLPFIGNVNLSQLSERFKKYENYKEQMPKLINSQIKDEEIFNLADQIKQQRLSMLSKDKLRFISEIKGKDIFHRADISYKISYYKKFLTQKTPSQATYSNNLSRNDIENLFRQYAPNLNPDGKIHLSGNQITSGSLSMNLENGLWHRFSTSEGGNIFSFIKQATNLTVKEVANLTFSTNISHKRRANKAPSWESYKIVPEDAVIFNPKKHIPYLVNNKSLEDIYDYRDPKGNLIGHTIRIKEGDKKLILPIAYCKLGNKSSWRAKGFSGPIGDKPIYGLEKLVNNKPVLIVEGEKTAKEAQNLLPNFNVISWLGGTGSVDKVNWCICKDKEAYIWPDNDQAGINAGKRILSSINNINNKIGKVFMVNPRQHNLPEKWDLADKLPENAKEHFIENILVQTKSAILDGKEKNLATEVEKRIFWQHKISALTLGDNEIRDYALLEEKFYNIFDSETLRNYYKYQSMKGDTDITHPFLNVNHEFYKKLLTSIAINEKLDHKLPESSLLDLAEAKYTDKINNFTDHLPYIQKYGNHLHGKSEIYSVILKDILLIHKMQLGNMLGHHQDAIAKSLCSIVRDSEKYISRQDQTILANRAYLSICHSKYYQQQFNHDLGIENNQQHKTHNLLPTLHKDLVR